MAYEQKTNSGSLFPNKRKEKETHPDLTGTLDVDGTQYWISAWSKTAKTNWQEWLSISIQPKEPQSQPARATPADIAKWSQPITPASTPAALTPSEDTDIPF